MLTSLMTPLRVRRARRRAVCVITPLVERSRLRFGDIPEGVWATPYVIGFITMLITTVARSAVDDLGDDALCRVQELAWDDITSRQSSVIGEELLLLSQTRNIEFEAGIRDGATLGMLMAITHTNDLRLDDDELPDLRHDFETPQEYILDTWALLFESRFSPNG
jgi:hypothetical protein